MYLWRLCAYDLVRVIHQSPDCLDLLCRPLGRHLNGSDHVENPRLPILMGRDSTKQPIVFVASPKDVSTEVERGKVEQAILDESQDIEDTTGAPIAVLERMDRFELVVQD